MLFTPLLPSGVISTDTGTLRRQVKVKRTTQPSRPTFLDPQKIGSLGIREAFVGSSPTRTLVRGIGTTASPTVTTVTTSQGLASSFTSQTFENLIITPSMDAIFSNTTATIAVFRRCRDTTVRNAVLFSGTDQRVLAHAPDNTGNLRWDFGNSTEGSGRLSVAYTKDTNWETLVFIASPTRGREVWRRGSMIASNPTATATRASSTLPWGLGMPSGGFSITSDNYDVALVVVSDKAWTPAQIKEWSANPCIVFNSTPFLPMVATKGIVSRPNSDLTVTNNTITVRRQIKVKRKTQPQMAAQIDWSNPITRGLLRLVGDTSQGEAITRSPVTKNGTVTYNKDSGYKFAASSSVSLLDAPADNWTVFCLAYTYSTAEEVNLVNRMGPATSSYAQNYVINFLSGVTPRVGHKNLSGGTYSYVQSSITPPTNSLCAAAGTFNGSTINVYTNGVNGGSVAATSPLQVATGYITQIGAGDGADKVRTYKGRGIQVAAIWNRALTPVEIKSISDNPYQIFKSVPQTMVYTKPGGGWSYNANTALYDSINEPSYTDIDAIVSPNLNATPGPVKFGLDTSLDTGTYNVNVRARRTDTTGDIRATLIDSAGNVVGTSSWQTLTEIYQTYTLSVTTTATASRVGFEVRP